MTAFTRSRSLRSIFIKRDRTLSKLSYEQYWADKQSYAHPRYDAIAKMITPDSTVLDVGCGDGTLLKSLRAQKNIRGMGIDYSENALERVRALGFEGVRADLDSDSFEVTGVYDHIVASEVVEHIKHSEVLIEKLWKQCRKSLILTIPNTGYYIDRLSLLFGTFPTQWIIHPGEHLRFWTYSDFILALNSMGHTEFQCVSISGLKGLHKVAPSLFSKQLLFEIPKPQ